MTRFFITFFLLFFISANIIAQQKHKLKPYTNDKGNLYWPKSKGLYLFVADNPEGNEKLKLESKESKKYTNPFYIDTEGINYIRTRYAVDPKTKQAVYPQIEAVFEIYGDGTPPTSIIRLKKANTHTFRDTAYFGKNLQISLSARDKHSGVNSLYYAINGDEFKPYTTEIPIANEGFYNFRYYSVDNVGNTEKVLVKKFIKDLTSPQTYHNITGIAADSVIAVSTKIYLVRNDSLSGIKHTYFKIDDGDFKIYDGKLIKTNQLKDGHHNIIYYSVDNVGNVENKKSFFFYYDKTAPIMSSDILGDRFVMGHKVYFSGRTKLNLIAIDNKSGVKAIMYAIDNFKYMEYKESFYLPKKPGEHIIRFYAIDNLNNKEVSENNEELRHNVSRVYVDLTAPSLGYSFQGKTFKLRDTTYVNSQTKLFLKAFDSESGLKNIKYSLDDVKEESLYETPLQIQGEGFHILNYFGYDNVNNRNSARTYFKVDNQGPEIYEHFSIPFSRQEKGINIYPPSLQVYLGATDEMTGNGEIDYSLNGAPIKKYSNLVRGFKSGKEYKLKIIAKDKLGNKKEKDITFKIE